MSSTDAVDNKFCDPFFGFLAENKAGHFLWIVCQQTIHMKYQAIFSMKFKYSMSQIWRGTLKPLFSTVDSSMAEFICIDWKEIIKELDRVNLFDPREILRFLST